MLTTSIRPRAWWTAALLMTATSAAAQEPFDFYGRGPYRPAVPRPDALLGYPVGTRHTQYAEQQAVLDALAAAAPDRVRVETIGTTEEGRVMRVLIISAAANIGRLDEIRSRIGSLRDPRVTSPREAATVAARDPIVVMLSYSIHGNEPAGFEAAMWVAYQLLASDEPATRTALENAVVVLNPSANPDGHERFAVWYNSLAVGSDEPFAHEWDEPWGIWGRFGHYRFDMNRDLVAASQAPVRAMLAAILRWSPQVFVDHHSTTEQFFFPPPALPVNQNLPPHALRWLEAFGRGNAAAFDRYGWQYYTRDIFDLFYAGYFDTGPALHGATGMTYETDGGKVLARRRDDGTVITFAEGIAHHYVASIATIETAAVNREERLLDFYDFHRTAAAAGASGVRRIVVLPDNDPTNAARLRTILGLHGVEVSRLTAPYAASAHAFADGPAAPARRRTFPAGALIVDLDQPRGRVARALLEPRAELDQEFVARQLERFERNRRRGEDASTEGYEFYDVTAWSLPFTLGLEAFWTDDRATLAVAPAPAAADDPALAAADADAPRPGPARSAYVFPNDRLGSAALAMALTREGFVLGVSTQPLRADGRSHPRGTMIARTSRNAPSLAERIAELAARYGVPVTAVQSAFPDSGGAGVGSESVRSIFDPRIVAAVGDGTTQTSYGALWHFLERELGEAFVPVRLASVGGMHTLSDYNVFIIPDGNPAAIRRELGETGMERLERWIRDGGVLIVYGRAALVPGHEDVQLSTVRAVGEEEEEEDDEVGSELPNDPALTPPLASPTAEPDAPAPLPGTIFRATLDDSHWLTLGYERRSLPVMLSGGTLLAPSEGGDNPVVFVGDSLLLAGWTWPDNTLRHLDGSVWAAVESVGRGHVVMFAEDPLFRAFWRGPARLLTNAMLFGARR